MVKQRAEKTFATREQAREAGYVPTEDLEGLPGRNPEWLKKIFKDAGIVPARVGHAYWWNEQEILTWAQTYKWQRPKGAPPLPCSIEGCTRDVWAHNMCLMHYRRARGAHADVTTNAGKPVGAGFYGRIEEDAEGKLICHECGKSYHSLGAHIKLAHAMSADEYRERYELPRSLALVSPSLKKRRSEMAKTPERIAQLARVRNPQAASAARDADSFRSMSRSSRIRHARERGEIE